MLLSLLLGTILGRGSFGLKKQFGTCIFSSRSFRCISVLYHFHPTGSLQFSQRSEINWNQLKYLFQQNIDHTSGPHLVPVHGILFNMCGNCNTSGSQRTWMWKFLVAPPPSDQIDCLKVSLWFWTKKKLSVSRTLIRQQFWWSYVDSVDWLVELKNVQKSGRFPICIFYLPKGPKLVTQSQQSLVISFIFCNFGLLYAAQSIARSSNRPSEYKMP